VVYQNANEILEVNLEGSQEAASRRISHG